MKTIPLLVLPILAGAAICHAADGTAPTTAPEAPQAVPAQPAGEGHPPSLAFPATVVSVSETSVTFKEGQSETTLPIGSWTKLVGVQSAAEIEPGTTIGVRLSADRKVVLVLNATRGR